LLLKKLRSRSAGFQPRWPIAACGSNSSASRQSRIDRAWVRLIPFLLHRDERLDKFSPRRQAKALVQLRDDLHLAALQHAQQVAAAYERADEFAIPEQVDDRLRDIFEPLFAIAAAADAARGIRLHVDAHDEGGQGAVRNPHRG